MQISIDQITNIGIDIVVDPKKLNCSICCNLVIDARECLNKKCRKLFCNNCILSLKGLKNNNSEIMDMKKKIPCPFCRVEADFYKAEETLNQKMNNFYFYIPDNTCITKYSLSEMKELLSNKKNLNFCNKCKDSNFMFYSKCYSCNNSYCSDCNIIKNCLSCEMAICEFCISNKFKNKENFFCDFCEPYCKACENKNKKNDAKEICEICFNILCKECTDKCEICEKIHCKDAKICKKKCEHKSENKEHKGFCIHKKIIDCEECFKKCEYKDNDYHNLNEKFGKSKIFFLEFYSFFIKKIF